MAQTEIRIKTVDGKDYEPNPSQAKLHQADVRYRLYSSSFGGGKTTWGCVEGLKLSLIYPNNRGLVGRMTYPEWRETTWRTMLDIIPPILVNKGDYHKSERKIILKNGSEIFGTSFDKAIKLASLDLGWVFLDEAREFPKETIRMVQGRLRYSRVPKHYMFMATNPDAKSHHLYTEFIAKPDGKHKVVLGSLEDNEKNLPPDYVEDLKSWEETDPEYFLRFVKGEWGAFAGRIYKTFSKDTHVIAPSKLPEIQEAWAGMDFGFTNPATIVVIGIDKDWNTYVADEFYRTGTTTEDWIKELKAFMARWKMRKVWGDPSEPGYIETIKKAGIPIEKANNDVDLGIMIVRERLGLKNGKPRHYICSNCVNTIREKELYREDPKRPGKILKKDDHTQDAERYGMMGIYPKLRGHSGGLARKGKGVVQPKRDFYKANRRSIL